MPDWRGCNLMVFNSDSARAVRVKESIITHRPAPLSPALFLLSFRHRDSLAGMAGRGGWRTIAARRGEGADQRFLESDAQIAVVDARDALFDGLEATRLLAGPVSSTGAALLILLGRKDRSALEAAYQAGATHYLIEPFIENDFQHALRFAERHARRLSGHWQHSLREGGDHQDDITGTDTRDLLTSLPDATAVHQWLGPRLAAPKGKLALLMVGISRYDAVNAAYGRRAGDLVLQMLARRIDRIVRATGRRHSILGRIAGSEFIIALQDEQAPEIIQIISEQITTATARPFVVDNDLINISCRTGVALARTGDDAMSLIRRTGLALTGSIPLDIGEDGWEVDLEVDLRAALATDAIDMLFQPQCQSADGRIIGVEALARWDHPVLGQINATTLFNVADRAGLAPQLSAHVQQKALALAMQWPASLDHIRLSINITAADIDQPDLAQQVSRMLAETGFPADRLTLEITESGLIDNLSAAAERLAELRAEGIRIAIDDFGTGYSSLAYLKSLPLDYLKIDQHFARDIAGSPRDRIVVRSVIEMALSLGLAVIAEGIETQEQLALIAAEGCGLIQGFLFAPPLTSVQLAEFAAGHTPN